MLIKRIPAGIYAANCYLIADEDTREAIVLDPGGDEDDIIKAILENQLEIKAVLLTHGHIDHVGAVKSICENYKVKAYISEKDVQLMEKGSYVFGNIKDVEKVYIKDNEVIKFGSIEVKSIETPGHTPGGLSFLIGENLFTGDTLFSGSIGRTDFEGGDYDTIIKSIIEKLIPLGDNVVVYPGHGPATSIYQEKLTNPFIN